MSTSDRMTGIDRRTFLRATCGAAAAATTVGATTGTAVAAAPDDLDAWFEGVDNYEGVVDRRGNDRVRVQVGAPGNGGGFAFEPAAVQVDPGATVVWEWTGEGGAHNVVATDDAYGSDLVGEAGATFEHAFEAEAVSRYVCVPHESMGMKGAVVVGDQDLGAAAGQAFTEPDYEGWFDGVSNFDGTVDATGQDEVRVQVGAQGNGGGFTFEPAAVHVDPGTTVVWEWTGDGGAHNVYDDEVGYESDLLSAAGSTYALTFDGEGVSRYACAPHEAMGMKGAVAVGNPASEAGGLSAEARTGILGLVLLAVLSPLVAAGALSRRRDRPRGPSARPR